MTFFAGARIRRFRDALRRLFGDQVVMLYTMGKVGSTSIEDWLDQAFHTHTLYGYPPSPPFHIQKYGKFVFLIRRYTVYPLKRFVIRFRPRVKIITFYRDPRDRNPSMFMHDLPFWLSAYISTHDVPTREEDAALLLTAYKEIFPHSYPGWWVKNELSRFTGIPDEELVLGGDNYRVVEKGRFSVFIGRVESLTDFLPQLAGFLDISEHDQVTTTNRGAAKWYAPIYRDFLQLLRTDGSIDYAEDFRRENGYANESQP